MQPQTKRKLLQRRASQVNDLYSYYEDYLPKSKEVLKQEIQYSLQPINIDGIFYQKKRDSIHFNSITPKNNNHNRSNQSHSILKKKDSSFFNSQQSQQLSDHNILPPKQCYIKNQLLQKNQQLPLISRDNQSIRERGNSCPLSQRGANKTPPYQLEQNIQVDSIVEADTFDEVYKKEEQELEKLENEANKNISEEEMKQQQLKGWGDISLSYNMSNRNVLQQVQQTTHIVGSNIQQIVNQQEQSKIICNLTSLDSIFKQAKNEWVSLNRFNSVTSNSKRSNNILPIKIYADQNQSNDLNNINLQRSNKFIKVNNSNQLIQNNYNNKQSINLKNDTLENNNHQNNFNGNDINNQTNNNIDKKNMRQNISCPSFKKMYSHFVKKVNQPHFVKETFLKQRNEIIEMRQSNLDFLKKNNNYQKPSESLDNQNNSLNKSKIMNDYIIENSSIILNKTKEISFHNTNSIFQRNKLNSKCLSGDASSLLSTKSSLFNSSNLQNNLNKYINKPTLSNNTNQDQIHQIKSNKQNSQNIQKNKEIQIPKYLIPYKELILKTWKGSIGPSNEENSLFSNNMGMLSLHKDMTENVSDVKEFQFKSDKMYLAVPSKSTRGQNLSSIKLKRQDISKEDLQQQQINLNIQMLDQIIQVQDPSQYILQPS